MDFADLHMHSAYSDGDWTPSKLVQAAVGAGLGALALTDHDDIRGWEEAHRTGREQGLVVLPGVELSAWWSGVDLHLLAYGFEPTNAGLLAILDGASSARLRRAEAIAERLTELGAPVTMESVHAIAGGATIGRPHVARALVEAGHVSTIREAFDVYLADGKPACVEKANLTPEEAIRVVHGAGGVIVVAHPGILGGPEELEPLVQMGVDGVEVRHSLHGRKSERAFDEFARTHGLLKTGGSDFHGPRMSGLGVGSVAIPRSWWDDLLNGIDERRKRQGLVPRAWEESKVDGG
ncbi:MAG: phosphatase [Gemmatimonadota bacterium]|nr:MAG: phosphatase [Gemmatimonadota bacterium]